MAEIQDELKIGIGTEEAITLKPAVVRVERIEVQEVGVKKARKVICFVRHPDSSEPIQISSVKYEIKGKLDTSGLWLNKDSKGLIRKGSALAIFLQYQGCNTIENLRGREIPTTVDESGYLVFKGY